MSLLNKNRHAILLRISSAYRNYSYLLATIVLIYRLWNDEGLIVFHRRSVDSPLLSSVCIDFGSRDFCLGLGALLFWRRGHP